MAMNCWRRGVEADITWPWAMLLHIPMIIALQPRPATASSCFRQRRVVPIDHGPFPLWREKFSHVLHARGWRRFGFRTVAIPQRQSIDGEPAMARRSIDPEYTPERAVVVYFYVCSETDAVSLFTGNPSGHHRPSLLSTTHTSWVSIAPGVFGSTLY